MGLGPLDAIGLADARERATAARRDALDGRDPLEARRAERRSPGRWCSQDDHLPAISERSIQAHKAGWRFATLRRMGRDTGRSDVYPTIGAAAGRGRSIPRSIMRVFGADLDREAGNR